MPLSLYNTLTRKIELFAPIRKDFVGLYACGPTVYWFAHIGNMRAFLFADVLRRVLVANDYRVKSVMNITDVGHLTSSEDEGEDRMIVAMQREGKSAYDIAEFYTKLFLQDSLALNILPADVYPRATQHIEEQIAMIQEIERNGFTYVTSDGVYFDTSKLPQYGVLSGQIAEEKKPGARVDMKEKRHATDFALWKFSAEGANREMEWDSPWGVGFPGWHIECTAMSTKYLGLPFDIHTGGEDHINIHHTNEIAQGFGAFGAQTANIWMHNAFITFNGAKISKSTGGLYTVFDLIEMGYSPLAYRYMVLSSHYRKGLAFSISSLKAAEVALNKLTSFAVGERGNLIEEYKILFEERLADDMAMPEVMALVWKLVKDEKYPVEDRRATLIDFDKVLGLKLGEEKVEEKIKKVKEVAGKEDAGKEDIEAATKDLSDTLSQIGQAMYQKNEPSDKKDDKTEGSETAEGEKGKKEEKVEEGEVVE